MSRNHDTQPTLRVVEDPSQIAKAQSLLMRNLKSALAPMGPRTIGFRGGNVVHPIFATGDGGLYYAYSEPRDDVPIKKHWNSFGVFRKEASAQLITVEINIPVGGNRPMVAGFFATDGATKKAYLMHNGAIGGGRKGIGQEAFLNYAAMPEVIVVTSSGPRRGLVIGDINDPNLVALIWRYVRVVEQFKNDVAGGSLTAAAPGIPADDTNYSPEFWGSKSGVRKEFDYVAYHGLVVDELRRELELARRDGARIGNSRLIDLYVQKGSERIEVFEVKTSSDRQSLYTGIGQLMVHGNGSASRKWLVVPAGEEIPADLSQAISTLSLQIRRFEIVGSGANARVKLL